VKFISLFLCLLVYLSVRFCSCNLGVLQNEQSIKGYVHNTVLKIKYASQIVISGDATAQSLILGLIFMQWLAVGLDLYRWIVCRFE